MRLSNGACTLVLWLLAWGGWGLPPAVADPGAPDGEASAAAVESADEPTREPAPAGTRVLSPGGIDILERAWFAPAGNLRDRVERLRWVAEQAGFENLDAPARAVLFGELSSLPLERSELAVELAPLLPAAQAALAADQWSNGNPGGSLRSWSAAALGLWFHLEAFLWFSATASVALLAAGLAAGFGYVLLRGLTALPLAARDVGEWIEPTMQGFARVALVASLVLAPAVLGEGALGALLVLYAGGIAYARPRARQALIAAAAVVVVALDPGAQLVGRVLGAVGADPLGGATWASEQGFIDPVDAARLREGSDRDSLVLHAVARRHRRAGDLATADAQLGALLATHSDDPVLLNDIANVRFARRETEAAIDYYREAAELGDSPEAWFNLSQAHGNRIEIGLHDDALAEAQRIDRLRVGELTQRLSESRSLFVADLGFPTARYRARVFADADAPFAEQLRHRFAPGWLGAHRAVLPVAFALLTALGFWIGRHLPLSGWCESCSAVVAPAQGATPPPLCEACRGERDARARGRLDALPKRSHRLLAHRALRLAALVVPGCGPCTARPVAALLGLFGAALMGVAGWWAGALFPDPLAVGAAAVIVGGVGVALGAGLYVVAGLLQRVPVRNS